VLLNQAVQRGLLGVVALVVIRGAVCCPLGLPVDGLHARPRGGDLRRSEAVRCSSMAQSAACRRLRMRHLVRVFDSPCGWVARKLPIATVGFWPGA